MTDLTMSGEAVEKLLLPAGHSFYWLTKSGERLEHLAAPIA